MRKLHLGHSCDRYYPENFYAFCDETASPNILFNFRPVASVYNDWENRILQPGDPKVLNFNEEWCEHCVKIYEKVNGESFPHFASSLNPPSCDPLQTCYTSCI